MRFPLAVPRLTVPMGLTLLQISGGAIDISNAADGSDQILDIFVSTYPTEDLLGGETVTWATSDTVFAAAIARCINKHAGEHHYWATSLTDHVFIWPQDPSVADTGTITCDDVSFTASIANMNAEQAFGTEANWDSGNYGIDIFAGTAMYLIGFDLDGLESWDDEWDLSTAKAVRLTITTEDQIAYVYVGGQGRGRLLIPASDYATTKIEGKRELNVLGAMQGHVPLFIQAGAANNPTYELDIW
jgi:hypothetical protein